MRDVVLSYICIFFFFKQKTAYEMRISDWSSDVCSSDLTDVRLCAISVKATFTVDGQELFLDIVRRHAVPIVCDGNRDIIGQRRQKDGEWVALELLAFVLGSRLGIGSCCLNVAVRDNDVARGGLTIEGISPEFYKAFANRTIHVDDKCLKHPILYF